MKKNILKNKEILALLIPIAVILVIRLMGM